MDIQKYLADKGHKMQCLQQVGEVTFLGLGEDNNLYVITILMDLHQVMILDMGGLMTAGGRIADAMNHFLEHLPEDDEESEVNEAALAAMVPVGGVH